MSSSKPPPREIQTWQIAEANAAAWMRYWGYADARPTGGSSDGGIDIRSRQAYAEVKAKSNPVGRPEIQKLVGARGLQHDHTLLFFSQAGYHQTAIAEANRSGVALFTFRVGTGEMAPVNRAAQKIASRPQPAPPSVSKDGPARAGSLPLSPQAVEIRWSKIIVAAIGPTPEPKRIVWPLLGAALFIGAGINVSRAPVSRGESSAAGVIAAVICFAIGALFALAVWRRSLARHFARKENELAVRVQTKDDLPDRC